MGFLNIFLYIVDVEYLIDYTAGEVKKRRYRVLYLTGPILCTLHPGFGENRLQWVQVLFTKMQMHHLWKQLIKSPPSDAWAQVDYSMSEKNNNTCISPHRTVLESQIREDGTFVDLTFCRYAVVAVECCRTEWIRVKYWVNLWISGAERPLVAASAAYSLDESSGWAISFSCFIKWWKSKVQRFLKTLKSMCKRWNRGEAFLCSKSI